jgi:hypothetical protein
MKYSVADLPKDVEDMIIGKWQPIIGNAFTIVVSINHG